MSKKTDPRRAGATERTIGALIRKKRLAAGISQERLAADIGVTFQQIQKYEKGINRVAFSRMIDIASALDSDITDFLP